MKPVPKYLQLKRELLSWLHSGRFKPGEQMPSENELADRFQLSRQTVRQTFGELEREGWLHRIQGKGTFVSSPRVRQDADIQTIGMLTTYISDYIFPHIVRGAEAALRSRGYRLALSSTENDKRKEQESLQILMSQPLSGLIVEPTKSALGNANLDCYLALQYRRIPFLMINERYAEMNCPCVKMDDEAGGFKAADYLIELGHREIAGFFKTDDLQGVNRMKGFLRAHQARRLPLAPDSIVQYATEEKASKPFQAALEMLRRSGRGRPTAFVCYNDELAVRLLEAIRQDGKFSVPEDISVVGFDDSPLATATEVKLTTLSHPKEQMGVQAAETLLEMLGNASGEKENPGDTIYQPELIIRNSSRRLLPG